MSAPIRFLLSRKARKAGRYVEGQMREVRNSAEELLELGKDEVARQQEGLKQAFEAAARRTSAPSVSVAEASSKE